MPAAASASAYSRVATPPYPSACAFCACMRLPPTSIPLVACRNQRFIWRRQRRHDVVAARHALTIFVSRFALPRLNRLLVKQRQQPCQRLRARWNITTPALPTTLTARLNRFRKRNVLCDNSSGISRDASVCVFTAASPLRARGSVLLSRHRWRGGSPLACAGMRAAKQQRLRACSYHHKLSAFAPYEQTLLAARRNPSSSFYGASAAYTLTAYA